jgi:hypothetical protein
VHRAEEEPGVVASRLVALSCGWIQQEVRGWNPWPDVVVYRAVAGDDIALEIDASVAVVVPDAMELLLSKDLGHQHLDVDSECAAGLGEAL